MGSESYGMLSIKPRLAGLNARQLNPTRKIALTAELSEILQSVVMGGHGWMSSCEEVGLGWTEELRKEP